MQKIIPIFSLILLFPILSTWSKGGNEDSQTVNVYSHRHYAADQMLYKTFEADTGIKVNVVQAKADELIERIRAEGTGSPADLLITVDAGRLVRAKELNLLQPVISEILTASIPAHLRDPEKQWFGLTKRARVIVWDKSRLKKPLVSTYQDLADPKLAKEILIRSSSNIYNISLLAAMIAEEGETSAKNWAEAIVTNMARNPQGNDRDQMKALVAGIGSYALVNTYYVGLLLNSSDPEESRVGENIGILFPNQAGRGTHINISGAGVAQHAPHPKNARLLLEFLSSSKAQRVYAEQNFEYPVNPEASPTELVASWGDFLEAKTNLLVLGENAVRATQIFDEVGWR